MRDIKGNVRKASNTGRHTANRIGLGLTRCLEKLFAVAFGSIMATAEIVILLRAVWFCAIVGLAIGLMLFAGKCLIDTIGITGAFMLLCIIGAVIGIRITANREKRARARHSTRRR